MATQTTSYLGLPAFIVDPGSIDRDGGHVIDWANVSEVHRATPGGTVVVDTAGAIKGATSIPVKALTVAVAAGTWLDFGGAGALPAKITAAAAVGATSLTCVALLAALTSGDSAIVAGSGGKFLKAGTVMGTALGSGKMSPRIASTNPAVGLLASDAYENDQVASVTGYGLIKGGVVYENLLPDATGSPAVLPTDYKTELQTAGVGTGFSFQQYTDTRIP